MSDQLKKPRPRDSRFRLDANSISFALVASGSAPARTSPMQAAGHASGMYRRACAAATIKLMLRGICINERIDE